jgi:hypothetical protein
MAELIAYSVLFREMRTVASKLSKVEELFAGRHFDREVIILCVRWYLRYKLSSRDIPGQSDGLLLDLDRQLPGFLDQLVEERQEQKPEKDIEIGRGHGHGIGH